MVAVPPTTGRLITTDFTILINFFMHTYFTITILQAPYGPDTGYFCYSSASRRSRLLRFKFQTSKNSWSTVEPSSRVRDNPPLCTATSLLRWALSLRSNNPT